MSHEELQDLLAHYAAARLSPDQRRFVEGHLADCAACRETVADLQEIGARIADGGDAMFAPHPDTGALRRHAAGGPGVRDPGLERHLELCASCRLEADFWSRRGVQPAARPVTGSRSRGWVVSAGWAAAAAIAGVFLGMQIERSRPGPLSTSASNGTTAAPAATLPGRSEVLHVLPGVLRGEGAPPQRWSLDRSETYVAAAVPLVLPAEAAGAERVLFELRHPGDGPVWSTEMTAASIRRHLETSEMVHVPDIPTASLQPGSYEFRVVPASDQESPIYRALITVVYRQSPAETNAPQ